MIAVTASEVRAGATLLHVRLPAAVAQVRGGSLLLSLLWPRLEADLCCFLDSSSFYPSLPLCFQPFNPLTLDRREKRAERKGKRSLDKARVQKGGDAILRSKGGDVILRSKGGDAILRSPPDFLMIKVSSSLGQAPSLLPGCLISSCCPFFAHKYLTS